MFVDGLIGSIAGVLLQLFSFFIIRIWLFSLRVGKKDEGRRVEVVMAIVLVHTFLGVELVFCSVLRDCSFFAVPIGGFPWHFRLPLQAAKCDVGYILRLLYEFAYCSVAVS